MDQNTLILESYLQTIQLEQFIEEFSIKDISSSMINKLKKSYVTNMKLTKQFLTDNGFNYQAIQKETTQVTKKFKTQLENGTAKKEEITKAVSASIIKLCKMNEKSTSFGQALYKSIILFLIVLFINSFLGVFAMALNAVVPAAGTIFLCCVVAPLTEETAKNISIKGKYPWVYTGLFSGLEALMYISQAAALGMTLPVAIVVRGMAMLFHFSTTIVQKHIMDEEKGDKKDYDEKLNKSALGTGIVMHACWNAIAISGSVMKQWS